jgi:calpain-15
MSRKKRHGNWENFIWKRPDEKYGEGGYVVYNKIGPNDIRQGACGDCYFLSSISSLSEYENRVERIFITKDVNEAGCYAVKLYINGEEKVVVVDDYFPYDPFKDDWAMAKPSADESKEIWVLIIEKAWAKVFGSYQRIEAGTAGEAFRPLTGCPSTSFIHDDTPDKQRLWKRILSAD